MEIFNYVAIYYKFTNVSESFNPRKFLAVRCCGVVCRHSNSRTEVFTIVGTIQVLTSRYNGAGVLMTHPDTFTFIACTYVQSTVSGDRLIYHCSDVLQAI